MPQGPSSYFFGCYRNIRYLESHTQYKGKIGKVKKIGLIIFRKIQAAGMRLRMQARRTALSAISDEWEPRWNRAPAPERAWPA